ncbi:MAG: tetratricopeptide repeat protein [Thermodesulfobacteriota bacterium]
MLHASFARKFQTAAALLTACALLLAGCQGFTPVPKAEQSEPAPEDTYTGSGPSYYYYTLALMLGDEGKLAEAGEALKRAAKADPDSLFLKTELARYYLESGDVDKARPLCVAIAEASPKDPKAYFLLGALEALAKNPLAAITAYESAISLDPERQDVYFVLGDLYFQSKQYDKAVELYQKLIEKDPESFQAWFFLGEARDKQGKTDEAVDAFAKAAEINPDLEQARFEIIRIYMDAGRKDDVVRTFREMLKGPSVNVKAALALAGFYLKEKDLENAEKTFTLLDEEIAKEPGLLRQVGAIYYETKYYPQAEKTFEDLVRKVGDPGDSYLLGLSQEAQGKKEEAITTYRGVPESSHSYSAALLKVAQLSGKKEDMETAFQAVSEDIAKGTATSENITFLTSIITEKDMLERGLSMLEKALAENPEDPGLVFALGVVQDKLGQKQECIETMKKLLVQVPDDAAALNYLGYTYADMGIELDQAEELIQKALSLRPEDGFIMDSLGWVYFKKGENQKALEILQRSAELAPQEPVILEHLGDAYAKDGKMKEAAEAYRKALSLQTSEDQKKTLEKKIGELKIP